MRLGSLELGGRCRVMGILNVTPDSFYDGGHYNATAAAVARGREMDANGAEIIDVGGESTRPGAPSVPEAEERERVVPVIAALAAELEIPISIDSRKPAVARAAVEAGAVLVNDVGGLRDPEMVATVAELDVPAVVMHMQGTPETMQRDPDYDEVVVDVKASSRVDNRPSKPQFRSSLQSPFGHLCRGGRIRVFCVHGNVQLLT